MTQENPITEDIVSKLRASIIEHSLPLWASTGWDSENGGFVERLHRDGTADRAAPRRVRVQARQIYCFAQAARLSWYPEGREVALKGLEFLLRKARRPDGRPGYVHLIAPDGSTINGLRDTYDHAFVLLALSTVYELTRDSSVAEEMMSLFAFIATDLRSADGGFIEGVPPTWPRRQNPQMHLLEAMIAAFSATGDPIYSQCATDLFNLFESKLFDPDRLILGEFFNEDWSKVEPVCVEPGHQAEWVWLLKGFERISGRSTLWVRQQLLESAERYRDKSTGCLVDEGDAYGIITKFTRRCWPQTEIVKAWLAQAESNVEGAEEKARKALTRLDRHYLQHPVRGGWYDQFDDENRSLIETIPASSFYHILCAVAEAERVMARSKAS